MRSFSITTHIEEDQGKQWPIDYKSHGFINRDKINPLELVGLAGWKPGENMVDVGVTECIIPGGNMDRLEDDAFDLENADSQFERDQIQDRIDKSIEESSYEIDGDFDSIGPQPIAPYPGESWVFILNQRLYLC
jgi:hypothetical protein